MDTLLQDIRYGVRMLLKSPTVAVVAIVTLALGIGANTAIFSTLNGLILRPPPVANADRLVVFEAHQESTGDYSQFSYADFDDLRSQPAGFSAVISYDLGFVGLDVNSDVQPALLTFVSGNYFQTLGIKPESGRFFEGEHSEKPGADPVVVLGYSYWKTRFHADPGVVGSQVKLNGHSATIIGIAPKGFHGLYSIVDSQIYLPYGIRLLVGIGDKDFWTRRDQHDVRVVGVLKPGTAMSHAQSSVDIFARQLSQQYPDTHKGIGIRLYPEKLARPEPDSSNGIVVVGILFMGLAGMVLLLACTNVANIVLVRATGREREMAVRSALGAGKLRLIRQLLTESLLLAGLGGLVGLAVGSWASNMLSSIKIQVANIPVLFDFHFDWHVFLYGFLAALLTGLAVGFAPAWRVSRSNLAKVLHEGSRGVLSGTSRSRIRSGLVMAQMAGSLLLLVVAGLFVRSAHNAERAYLGFDPTHILNMTMDTRTVGFDEARTRTFVRELEDRVRTLPGVQFVSFADSVPMGYSNRLDSVYLPRSVASEKAAHLTEYNAVDPSYFSTMRMPLLRGRGFAEQDNDKSPQIAIVNETMARRFWPNQEVLGQRFSVTGPQGPFREVVGVVNDAKYNSPIEDPQPFFYVPLAQSKLTYGTLQVRTAGSPHVLIPEVDQIAHELAPGLPIIDVQSMEEELQGVNGFFLMNMGTRLTSILGVLGLVLALVGVYGVISYVAAQRIHEIGVRMALGASRMDIMKMVLRQGFILVGGGIVAGLALTFLGARSLSSLMVGISATDPLTLSAVSLFLGIVGLAASFIPARRAMKVEPLKALKYE